MIDNSQLSEGQYASETRAYYDQNAEQYYRATVDADLSALHERFLAYIPEGGRILDAGSGSGRDTLAFLKRGCTVDAFDASAALTRLSSRLTGQTTAVMSFGDVKSQSTYDGIWACASLLHVPLARLPATLRTLVEALKLGGAIYASFKYGTGERRSEDRRAFTDMDVETFNTLIHGIPLVVRDVWISGGEDVFQGKGEWFNVIGVRQQR